MPACPAKRLVPCRRPGLTICCSMLLRGSHSRLAQTSDEDLEQPAKVLIEIQEGSEAAITLKRGEAVDDAAQHAYRMVSIFTSQVVR